ncbi:hypothetical protein EMIT047CA2_40103 [Pseudomonas soli]
MKSSHGRNRSLEQDEALHGERHGMGMGMVHAYCLRGLPQWIKLPLT